MVNDSESNSNSFSTCCIGYPSTVVLTIIQQMALPELQVSNSVFVISSKCKQLSFVVLFVALCAKNGVFEENFIAVLDSKKYAAKHTQNSC